MAPLGRAALLLAFGLVAYALVAGSYAAWKRRRRLALSAQNALLAAFPVTLVAAIVLLVALGRRDMTFVYVWQHTSHKLPLGYALSAFWGGQEGSLLLWLLVLTGYAGLAVWLNRRSRELIAWTVPVFGLIAVFFAFMLCFVSSPFNVAARAGGRQRHGAEPAEPVHARPPAAALPRLRRALRAVRVRDGRAPLRPHRRALDRGDAPLDARGLDVPRRRPADRRPLGVRRDRLGRLLRLGSGRERRAHAVARCNGVPPLGDDPGEARDAEGLEHDPRRARVQPLALRHVPHALGRDRLDPLVLEELDRRLVPRLPRPDGVPLDRAHPLAPAAVADEDEARVARLARGDVPLQQPAARRPLPHDPLGCALSDPHRRGARPVALGRGAVLRLLPPHLRAAAAAPDGDRPARGVAEGVAPLAQQDVRHPVHGGRRDRRRAARARLRQLAAGPAHVHVLGLRRRLDRARVRARTGGRGRRVPADLPEPAALRRLRRARRDRPARDRDRGLERLPDAAGADPAAGAVDARPPATRSRTPASPA